MTGFVVHGLIILLQLLFLIRLDFFLSNHFRKHISEKSPFLFFIEAKSEFDFLWELI